MRFGRTFCGGDRTAPGWGTGGGLGGLKRGFWVKRDPQVADMSYWMSERIDPRLSSDEIPLAFPIPNGFYLRRRCGRYQISTSPPFGARGRR